MNKKGFTLVELLATLIVLGIVIGITIVAVNHGFGNAKDKTEEVFIKTLTDALDIYIDTDAKGLNYGTTPVCTVNKRFGEVDVYKATNSVSFYKVINSEYSPLVESDLVNPANDSVSCNSSDTILVNIYRDGDGVYYYKVSKASFGCLKTTGNISNYNLPNECS